MGKQLRALVVEDSERSLRASTSRTLILSKRPKDENPIRLVATTSHLAARLWHHGAYRRIGAQRQCVAASFFRRGSKKAAAGSGARRPRFSRHWASNGET